MITEFVRRLIHAMLVRWAGRVTGFTPHYQVRYSLYTQGPRWFILRNVRLWWDGWQCTQCGDRYPLQVHHVSYRNRGEGLGVGEFLDLRTLCSRCHSRAHGKQQ